MKFFAAYGNWLLALLAACLWFGVAGWYFAPIIWRAWRERHNRFNDF